MEKINELNQSADKLSDELFEFSTDRVSMENVRTAIRIAYKAGWTHKLNEGISQLVIKES